MGHEELLPRDPVERRSIMQKRIAALLVSVLLILSMVACTAAQDQAQEAEASRQTPGLAVPQTQRSITVVGVGRVSLVPDIARIEVGAEARASTVAEAKAEVDRQIDAIMAALVERGIAERDVQTSHYGIYFERETYPGPAREGGPALDTQGAYRVSNMLQVTVRNVDAAGDILDGVVEAGANQVYGVTFTVADDSKWQSEARKNAVADAVARGEELASLTGVELGEVKVVSEVIGSGPVPVAYAERAMGGGGIAPGKLELSTQVQVTFSIQ
jgi:uncharacterized protein YggE